MKLIKMLIKSIISLLIGTIMVPLNAALIPLAIINIIRKALITRFRNIEGDLKTFIPVTIHKTKQKFKKRKK